MSHAQRRAVCADRSAVMIALAIALASAPGPARAGEDLGFVLDLSGKWQVASDGAAPRPLAAGHAVKAGDRLMPGAADARATVVLLDGERLDCPANPRCGAPLGGKTAQPGAATRLMRAVSGLFSSPDRYATTMSRGEELAEAVVEARGDKTDLTQLLAPLPAGAYQLRLCALAADRAPCDAPVNVNVTWNPAAKRPPSVKLGKLAPGLYVASLESGADAWVLLSPPARYRRDAADFDQARKLAAGWGSGASSRAVRGFLRAGLDAVARGEVSGSAEPGRGTDGDPDKRGGTAPSAAGTAAGTAPDAIHK